VWSSYGTTSRIPADDRGSTPSVDSEATSSKAVIKGAATLLKRVPLSCFVGHSPPKDTKYTAFSVVVQCA